ncbi:MULTISPECIES: DUF4942 domain-containing protein [Burkholderia]|uniref:DUF4942 domain-containing protein n=1 Tax=Burkholderia TaxID=32008 RepID=UPI000A95051C|nr:MULTISPECIES: DUF4942 domain-containing protein [Burkholderia]
MDSTDLVKSISVTNLANQRVAVVERVRAALDLLGEAQALAKAAHLGFPRLVLDESYGCRGRPTVTGEYAKRDDAEAAMVRIIDVRGWDYLLSESGLRTFMDAKAREQWSSQIAEGDVPELTAANIKATFAQLYGARGDMFERGVLQCFKRLSWDYKTNQPFKFGKRTLGELAEFFANLNLNVRPATCTASSMELLRFVERELHAGWPPRLDAYQPLYGAHRVTATESCTARALLVRKKSAMFSETVSALAFERAFRATPRIGLSCS